MNATQTPEREVASAATASPVAPTPAGGFFNPYFQVLLSVMLSAAAQVFLKKGVDQSVHSAVWLTFIFSCLLSVWVWAGIACMIGSLFAWLYGLKYLRLIIAFNVAGLVHVVVPLTSWLFLGEKLGPTRILGIALVFAGVLVVAKPAVKVEEL